MSFQLVRRQELSEGDNTIWFKVYFTIIYEGGTDGGADDCGLILLDGQWYITSVPT